MFEYYKARLELLTDIDSLNAELDTIADDDTITNEEYAVLYTVAINKFRR